MNLDDIITVLRNRFTQTDGEIREADRRIIYSLENMAKNQHKANIRLILLQEAICNRFIADNKEAY